MGKTITRIATIAVGVAFVATGAGAFIGGAVLSAVGTSFAGVAITTALAAAANTIAISAAIQATGGLLGLGPKTPKPQSTEGPIKTAIPPRVSAYGRSRLYGAYALYETASDGTAVDVFAVHDGQIDAIEQYYLGDDKVTPVSNVVPEGSDGRYAGDAVHIYSTMGQAIGTAFSAVIGFLPGIYTTNHRGDGVVMLATTWRSVKSKNFQETYPQGQPVPASIAARWQKVFDWRDGTQSINSPATWKWSENAVLHHAHYELVRNGRDWETHFLPTLAYWTAAANDADVAMALKGGGTEPRYRSCVSHKHTDPHKGVIGNLTAAYDGWIAPRADGALVVYSGRYYAPTVNIGPDDIVSYNWEYGVEDENAVNELVVSYISADNDFNTVETDSWRDEDDIAVRGEIRSQSLENQVPSHSQARRLAKRAMFRAMAPSRGTVTTNFHGRIARGQRYINLRLEEAGAIFFNGPAEITALTRNLSTGGITFTWVAASPDIDGWSPATEEGDAAPIGNRVAPEPLEIPEIDAITVIDGPRLSIDVIGPDRSDLTWFAHTRPVGATLWGTDLEYGDTDPGSMVTLITDIVPDTNLEVEVAYAVGDGRVSAFSPPFAIDATPDVMPPTDFSAANGTGSSLLTWTNPTTGSATYYRLYHGTTSTFGSATQLNGDISGGLGASMSHTYTGAPGTHYFWVRAFDPLSNPSALVGPDSAVIS